MEKIIILGCGGHAKSVIDVIEAAGKFEICGFVDHSQEEFEYRGYKIIGCDDDLKVLYDDGIHHAFIGIGFLGQGNVRNRLYGQLKGIGYNLPSVIDPTAVMASDVTVGEGTFIGKRAIVNANSVIGQMVIINTGAIIEHDCHVGDYSHISVSSVVCGAVHIGENVFLGANATVFQEMCIGNNAVIGAGSIVYRNVEADMKYISKTSPIVISK